MNPNQVVEASADLKNPTLDGNIHWKVQNFVTLIQAAREVTSPDFRFPFPKANKTFNFGVKILFFEDGIEFRLMNRNQDAVRMSAQLSAGLIHSSFADKIPGLGEKSWSPREPLRKFLHYYSSSTSLCGIEVRFSIFDNLTSTTVAGLDYVESEPTLQQSLKSLLTESTLFDFVIECGTKKFPCHKAILANRSDVFARLFSSNDWAENKENVFPINDHSPDVIEQMLVFIYTNKIPEGTTSSLNLLIIADQFNLKGLIQLCESDLSKTMTHQNAIEILNMADKIPDTKRLRNLAAEYVYKNMLSLVSPDNWKKIVESSSLLDAILNINNEK